MLTDDKFRSLLDQLAHAHSVALDAAYESGRRAARTEMREEMKALKYLFADDDADDRVVSDSVAEVGVEEPDRDPDHRAPPGSVKPTIERLITERPGLTTGDIKRLSGLKPNSVRGTLWALKEKDKTFEQREGRWYPAAQNDEAVGVESVEDAPTASVEGDNKVVLGGATPDRGPQAAERLVADDNMISPN